MTRADRFAECLSRLTRGIARLDLLKPGDLVERRDDDDEGADGPAEAPMREAHVQ